MFKKIYSKIKAFLEERKEDNLNVPVRLTKEGASLLQNREMAMLVLEKLNDPDFETGKSITIVINGQSIEVKKIS